jgi:transposase
MSELLLLVSEKHATSNVKAYCLYMHFFLGLTRSQLSKNFNKSQSTISTWIHNYESGLGTTRKIRDQVLKKFSLQHREWIVKLYKRKPILFLDEAAYAFRKKFQIRISKSYLHTILYEAGLTWKVLERRAIQICFEDIYRFTIELGKCPWLIQNIVFLDEVGFDNRGMLRKRGYGLKGKKLLYRGEFIRKPRRSLLCFIGVHGLLECFLTEGTFDRSKFFACCREFALESGQVRQYPGPHSVWILDGATIHCHPNIIYYLRSLGILPIFLPAYCPFFNPIEIFFGMVKREMQRFYVENKTKDLTLFIARMLNTFKNYDFKGLFRKCGWDASGFNPGVGLKQELKDLDFENTV